MSQLTKNSSQEELKNYFTGVLVLSKSEDPFPVDLDDVWPLAYERKDHAVRDLKKDKLFIEGFDFTTEKSREVFPKFGENPLEKSREVFTQLDKNPLENPEAENEDLGGRPTEKYYLTTACLEFFIARKVRPVFEIYRKALHFVMNRDEGFLLAAVAPTYYSLNAYSTANDIASFIGDMYSEQKKGNLHPIFLTEVFAIAFPTLQAAINELTRKDGLVDYREGSHFIRVTEGARKGYFLSFEEFNQLIGCRKAIVGNAYNLAVQSGEYRFDKLIKS